VPDFSHLSVFLRDRLKKYIKLFVSSFDARGIPVGLAILTVVLGVAGWSLQLHDFSFESLASVAFKTLGNFSPAVKNLAGGNLITQIAAVCGLLAIYSSALLIAANFLRESRRKLFARLFYSHHSIIIGDTPLCERVNRIWSNRGERFLQIISSETANQPDWQKKIVRHKFDESLIKALALHRAKHVFIDLGDDIQTYSLAFQLLSALPQFQLKPNASEIEREWIITGRDINLADHFSLKFAALSSQDEKLAKPIIHYLDPDQLIARHFMAAHPLFLLAHQQNQHRVHMMIVDFGWVSRHLLESTFLTALTTGFAHPCVTVVTKEADAQKKIFFATRPALTGQLDIAFFEADTLLDLQRAETKAAQMLHRRDEKDPVTLIVLASEDIENNIANAFLIDSMSKKLGRFNCPVFALERQAEEAAFLLSRGKFSEAIGGFALFGLPSDLLELQLCESKKRDALAKALHAQYAAASAAIPSWNNLPESFRRANRNAADHWRAKMYAFGYDVGHIAPGILPCLPETDAQTLLGFAGNGDLKTVNEKFMDVVQLEHERWMLERGLDGWVFGKERDNVRRFHPSLIPWDDLIRDFPAEVLKDIEQIKGLITLMTQAGDPKEILEKMP